MAPSHNLNQCWLENLGILPRQLSCENHNLHFVKFGFEINFHWNFLHIPGANELYLAGKTQSSSVKIPISFGVYGPWHSVWLKKSKFYHFWASPCDYTSVIPARITKFVPEVHFSPVNSLAPGGCPKTLRKMISKFRFIQVYLMNSEFHKLVWGGCQGSQVSIDSGYGLVLSGNKPWPEPMLTYLTDTYMRHSASMS